jgi:hypothetical protein
MRLQDRTGQTLSITARALAVTALLWLSVAPLPAQAAEEKGPAAGRDLLMKAHEQLEIALHYSELAVAPHQPGHQWHRSHVKRAINILVGEGNPDFSKDVENPGDGHGVIKYLQEAQGFLKGCGPVMTCDAIESTLEYIRAAIDHGKQSTDVERRPGLVLHQARMFGALLRVAHGTRDTESPTTGALEYAMRMAERMAEHK